LYIALSVFAAPILISPVYPCSFETQENKDGQSDKEVDGKDDETPENADKEGESADAEDEFGDENNGTGHGENGGTPAGLPDAPDGGWQDAELDQELDQMEGMELESVPVAVPAHPTPAEEEEQGYADPQLDMEMDTMEATHPLSVPTSVSYPHAPIPEENQGYVMPELDRELDALETVEQLAAQGAVLVQTVSAGTDPQPDNTALWGTDDKSPKGDEKQPASKHIKEPDMGSGGSGATGSVDTGQGTGGEPVIIPTGNFFREETDLPCRRSDSALSFTRYYNSVGSGTAGSFGYGWRHRFEIRVVELPDGAAIYWGDGAVHTYKKKDGMYVKPAGVFNALQKDGKGNFFVVTPHKVTYAFDAPYHKNVTRISDLNGVLFTMDYHKMSNKLAKVTDRWGDWVSLKYNGTGTVSEVEDSTGRTARYAYDRFRSNLTSVIDCIGDRSIYKYDRRHNLTEKEYSDGVKVTTVYDKKRRAVEQGDGKQSAIYRFIYFDRERKVSYYEGKEKKADYYYNRNNKIVKESDARGGIAESGYDKRGQLTTYLDKSGCLFRYAYDAKGNMIETVDPLGNKRRYDYDPVSNKVCAFVNELGVKTVLNRDERGNLVEIIDGVGARTTFANDAYGRPALITDPEGRTLSIAYDGKGNVERVTRASGGEMAADMAVVEQFVSDNLGNPSRHIDPNGHITDYGYDVKGRVVSVTRNSASGQKAQTNCAYDQFDNLVSVRDPMGNLTRFEYEKGWWNKLSMKIDAAGTRTRYRHDVYGKLLERIDGENGVTAFYYDPAGNVESVVDPAGNKNLYHYDRGGRMIEAVDANYNGVSFFYDMLGRVIETKDGEGLAVRCGFDAAGNLTSVTDSKGGTVAYAYDKVNRLIKETDQMGNEALYEYNARGALLSKTDPAGRKMMYAYDPFGRLSRLNFSDGSGKFFRYDPAGNMLGIQKIVPAAQGSDQLSVGGIEYQYDEANRVAAVKTGNREILYGYDLNGNRTSMAMGDKIIVKYGNDALNRVTVIDDGRDRVTYAYDSLGRRVSRSLTNGMSTGYAYDKAGNLCVLETKNRGGTVLDSFEYKHDRVGNRTGMTTLSGAFTYTYDRKYQLVGVGNPDGSTETYSYDGNGNRVKYVRTEAGKDTANPQAGKGEKGGFEETYTYNQVNQLVNMAAKISDAPAAGAAEETAVRYEYDKTGNLVKEVRGVSETAYTYDGEDRLIGAAADGKVLAEYAYDVLGRRVMKKEGGRVAGYVYDGLQIIMETNGQDGVRSRILNGVGIDEPISENGEYFIQDGLGSVSAVADRRGAVKERYIYSAFGRPDKIPRRFGYTGREYDASIGHYYYRARYYNPSLGRFTQLDPLGMVDGVNRYAYVRNNPVRYVDPLGLLTIYIHGTWSDSTTFNPSFLERSLNSLGENRAVCLFNWSGDNTGAARSVASYELARYIENYKFKPGEKLNIIGHSHGGNVALDLSHITGRKVNNLVLFNTPIRDDYRPKIANIEKLINVYSPSDKVQTMGGYNYYRSDANEFGEAQRTLDGAINIEVTDRANGPVESHSSLMNAQVWDQHVNGVINNNRNNSNGQCR
jgi:RHS repeat-associated protein